MKTITREVDRLEALDYVRAVSHSCAAGYYKAVDAFLRTLGVTSQNVSRYELRVQHTGDLDAEVWHKGTKVGSIVTRWSVDDGYRFSVECRVGEVYCHACSLAGGADMPVRHDAPACE